VELVIPVAAEFQLLHPIIVRKEEEGLGERTYLSFLSVGMS